MTDLFLGPDEGLGFVVVRIDVGIDVFLKLAAGVNRSRMSRVSVSFDPTELPARKPLGDAQILASRLATFRSYRANAS